MLDRVCDCLAEFTIPEALSTAAIVVVLGLGGISILKWSLMP